MVKEKRKYARAKVSGSASIHKDDTIVEGGIVDLSMNGAFIAAVKHLKIDDEVTVTIYHTLTPKILTDLKARVARVTDMGVGLHFEKLLID